MGIILIMLIGIPVIVWLIYLFAAKKFAGSLDALGLTAVIDLALICIIAASIYFTSIDNRIKLVSYYDTNYNWYTYAENKTQEGIINITGNGNFNTQEWAQIQLYAQMVYDKRNEVIKYNKEVICYKYWQDNWLIGLFWVDLPNNIKPITIN